MFLIGLDVVAIALSWFLVNWLSSFDHLFLSAQDSGENFILKITVIQLSILIAAGMYSTGDQSRRLKSAMQTITLSYVAFLAILELSGDRSLSSLFGQTFLLGWLLNILIALGDRWLIFKLIAFVRSQFLPLRRKILLVGNTEDIKQYQLLFANNDAFKVCSAIDLQQLESHNYFEQIWQQFLAQNVDEVFICSWNKIDKQTRLFWNLQTSGISWRILPMNRPIPQHDRELTDVEGIPTIRYENSTIIGFDFWLKRIFDLIFSSLLLIILGLPMAVIALLIKLNSPGDIFYKQIRVGLKGRKFKVWKFRTMFINASQLQRDLEAKNEVSGGILFKIKDDPRITKVGKILRKFSLDELPQIFNVLRGEMSLVGPRPLPVRDVAKFSPKHHFRHEVLPGITGLWQVSGRSDTNSENVFDLDFEYIRIGR